MKNFTFGKMFRRSKERSALLFHVLLLCACTGQIQPVALASQPTPTATQALKAVTSPPASDTPLPAHTLTNGPLTPVVSLQEMERDGLERNDAGSVQVEPYVSDLILLEKIEPTYEVDVPHHPELDEDNEAGNTFQPGQFPLTGQNLLLPDLVTLPPTDLHIRTISSGERKLLRFTNSIMNTGPGKIELWGTRDPETGKVTVIQYIYNGEDAAEKVVVGEFFFHPEHDHWHFGNFAIYELWSLDSSGSLESKVALSSKVSYCLRDDARSDIPDTAPRQTYTSCGQERQGISVGWIDIYRYYLPGQNIDITSLQDGFYALRSIVDPENNLWEGDRTNNTAILYIELRNSSVTIVESSGIFDKLQDNQE